MYKTGETVHIQAMCWGDHGEHSVPVSLRPHAGRLEVRGPQGLRRHAAVFVSRRGRNKPRQPGGGKQIAGPRRAKAAKAALKPRRRG